MEQFSGLTSELINQLQCMILPGKHIPQQAQGYYQTVYAFWQEEWSATFKNDSKEKVPDVLYSDDFRRQDQIICLFYQATPIATFSLDWIDLELAADRQQSCMRHYPTEVLQKLIAEKKSQIIMMSYMLVAKQWRRHRSGLPIADILPGLTAKILLASEAACAMGITRDDVKSDEVVMRHGFQPHGQLRLYGVAATMMIMTKDSIQACPISGIPEVINYLWENRMDFALSKTYSTNEKVNI